MADHFRLPTDADREPEPPRKLAEPTVLSRALQRVGENVNAVLGCLGSLAFAGLLVVLWVADAATCFGGSARGPRVAELTPRAPLATDSIDLRLVRRFGFAWVATEHNLDSAQVWIVDSREINAASMGHRAFVLWRGLNSLSDSSIDAVVAHEIAHEDLHHVRKSVELGDFLGFLVDVVATIGGRDDAVRGTLRRWTGKFVLPHYSRAQELQADSLALTNLKAVGYEQPGTALCQTFEKLRSSVGDGGGSRFADHPSFSVRIGRIRTIDNRELGIASACK